MGVEAAGSRRRDGDLGLAFGGMSTASADQNRDGLDQNARFQGPQFRPPGQLTDGLRNALVVRQRLDKRGLDVLGPRGQGEADAVQAFQPFQR